MVRHCAFPLHRLVLLTNAMIGFVYGAFQAYARALYAELIPKGNEAKWYALFSITDKVGLRFFSLAEQNLISLLVLLVCWPLSSGINC